MASMTLSELSTKVMTLVGDNSNYTPATGEVAGDTFSTSMITDSINMAIREYCKRTRASYHEASASISNNVITIPADSIEVIRVIYNGYVLVLSSNLLESLKNPYWMYVYGSAPLRWLEYNSRTIKLSPLMAAWSPSSVVIGYIQAPTALSSSSDTIDSRVIESHQEYLKYAAASFLLSITGDTEDLKKSAVFTEMFNKLVGA